MSRVEKPSFLEVQLANKQEQVAELKAELIKAAKKYEELRAERDNETNSLQEEINRLKTKLAQKAHAVAKQQQIGGQQRLIADALTTLRDENPRLQQDLIQANRIIDELRSQMQPLKRQIAELSDDNARVLQREASLRRERIDTQNALDDLAAELSAKSKEHEDFKREHLKGLDIIIAEGRKYWDERDYLAGVLEKKFAEIDELTKQIQALQAREKEYQQTHAALNETIRTLEKKKHNLKKRLAVALKADTSKVSPPKEEKIADASRMESQEADNPAETTGRLESENADLKRVIAQLQAELASKERQVQEQAGRHAENTQRLESENIALREELAQLRSEASKKSPPVQHVKAAAEIPPLPLAPPPPPVPQIPIHAAMQMFMQRLAMKGGVVTPTMIMPPMQVVRPPIVQSAALDSALFTLPRTRERPAAPAAAAPTPSNPMAPC